MQILFLKKKNPPKTFNFGNFTPKLVCFKIFKLKIINAVLPQMNLCDEVGRNVT